MSPERPHSQPPTPPVDPGSQALAEALRSSFGIVKFVMLALFVVFLFSGFFTVDSQEKAIKLRFGKPQGEGETALLGSGAHWALPYPIDEVVKIPITEIQEIRSRTHWFAQTALQEAQGEIPPVSPGTPLNPAVDGYALTGDGNIIHAKATLRYRIEDPVRCVFEFASGTNQNYDLSGISNAVLNVLDNALVYAASRFRMDDTLFNDKLGFQDVVQRRVNRVAQEQNLGIVVDQCIVECRQPRQLDVAFKWVTDAGQKRSTAITTATTYRNQVISRAGADAAGRLNTAQTERKRMVDGITSDAANFAALLPKYQANPDLFIQQRLVETMGRVFTNAQDKLFLPPSGDGKTRELRLLLNRELPKPKAEPAKP